MAALGNFDVFDLGAKMEIHATILEERIYWSIQIFILIVACDVKTVQDTQAVEVWEILLNSASELCCAVPRLKAESS